MSHIRREYLRELGFSIGSEQMSTINVNVNVVEDIQSPPLSPKEKCLERSFQVAIFIGCTFSVFMYVKSQKNVYFFSFSIFLLVGLLGSFYSIFRQLMLFHAIRERLMRMEQQRAQRNRQSRIKRFNYDPQAPPPIRAKWLADMVTQAQAFETCCICLSQFDPGDDLSLVVPCLHVFHEGCLQEWLNNQGRCPYCKANLDLSLMSIERRLSLSSLWSFRRHASLSSRRHDSLSSSNSRRALISSSRSARHLPSFWGLWDDNSRPLPQRISVSGRSVDAQERSFNSYPQRRIVNHGNSRCCSMSERSVHRDSTQSTMLPTVTMDDHDASSLYDASCPSYSMRIEPHAHLASSHGVQTIGVPRHHHPFGNPGNQNLACSCFARNIQFEQPLHDSWGMDEGIESHDLGLYATFPANSSTNIHRHHHFASPSHQDNRQLQRYTSRNGDSCALQPGLFSVKSAAPRNSFSFSNKSGDDSPWQHGPEYSTTEKRCYNIGYNTCCKNHSHQNLRAFGEEKGLAVESLHPDDLNETYPVYVDSRGKSTNFLHRPKSAMIIPIAESPRDEKNECTRHEHSSLIFPESESQKRAGKKVSESSHYVGKMASSCDFEQKLPGEKGLKSEDASEKSLFRKSFQERNSSSSDGEAVVISDIGSFQFKKTISIVTPFSDNLSDSIANKGDPCKGKSSQSLTLKPDETVCAPSSNLSESSSDQTRSLSGTRSNIQSQLSIISRYSGAQTRSRSRSRTS